MPLWIEERVRERRGRIEGRAAALLADLRGNDTMRLAVGSGATSRTQAEQAKARITSHLFHYFVSTEGGIMAFTSLDTPEDLRWHRLVPGRMVEIVDASDRPVPIGEVGRVRGVVRRAMAPVTLPDSLTCLHSEI